MTRIYSNYNIQVQKRNKVKFLALLASLFIVTIFAVACSNNQKMEDKNVVAEAPAKKAEATYAPKPTSTQVSKAQSGIKNIVKDFKPSDEVVHGKVAIAQGDFIFYRAGKLHETNIIVKNIKTSDEETLVTLKDGQLNPSEMYLLGNNLYYQEDNDIYRIGIDGENKIQLFKGTASILGIANDNIIALNKNTKEIIRINHQGENMILAKVSSINPLEIVVMENGIYYTNKKSNNTSNGNNPTDRLYYIDFNGNNKTEIDAEIDIYDLKSNENELFYLSISNDTEDIRIKKVVDGTFSIIHTITQEELETLTVLWYDSNTFTILGVNETNIYYGINTESLDTLAVYSVRTNGESPELYMNINDLPGIDPSAYFRSGMMDDVYLKIVLDCDSNPVQVYIINLKEKSSIMFQGGYYNSNTIDVLGDTIYYCKSSKFDAYMDFLENWEYGHSKISSLY